MCNEPDSVGPSRAQATGPDVNHEYRALVDKVDAFCSAAAARDGAGMTCAPGCSSCCQVWLSVCAVERAQLQAALKALAPERRAQLAARGREQRQREHSGAAAARCAMLDRDGRCVVYAARPLVCRTQGLALRYPAGIIPEAAVRARSAGGEITHCPLNFAQRLPSAQSVLDAERVDELLAVINARHTHQRGQDPHARYALSAIAADALEPEQQTL